VTGILIAAVSSCAEADPIKLRPIAVATSNNTYAGWVADGDSSTLWSSGESGVAWVQLDLGRTTAVRQIRLQTGTTASSPHAVQISVGTDPKNLRTVSSADWPTTSGQWFTINADATPTGDHLGNVRYVRVSAPSAAWREIEIYQGLEYFSYYFSLGDYPATISGGGNLGWVGGWTSSEIINYLSGVRANGGKAVVMLNHSLVFPCASDQGTIDQEHLCNGTPQPSCGSSGSPCLNAAGQPQKYQDILADFAAKLDQGGYWNSIAAFEILEEPDNLNHHGTAIPNSQPNSAILAQWVHAHGKPTLALFNPGMVAGDPNFTSTYLQRSPLESHPMFDWVGIDCYGAYAQCNSVFGSPYSTTTLYSSLRSKLGPDQRMIAVLTAAPGLGLATEQQIIDSNLNPWYKALLADWKFIAVMPFSWGGGTQNMPFVRERLRQFGHSITAPTESYVYAQGLYDGVAAHQNYQPFYAFDNDPTTYWTVGTSPQYSIQMDLYGSTRVSGLQLVGMASPSPSTSTHIIEGCPASSWPATTDCTAGQNPSAWFTITTYQGSMYDNQYIPLDFVQDVSSLRIRTTQGSAWEGWREIGIVQAQPVQHASVSTASPTTFGGDAYHVDQYGRLWHLGTSWSLVSSAPSTPLRGGIARLTSTSASNFDAIVTVGNNGHLYQYFTQNGSAYAWRDMGLPTGCDAVVGNPAVATGPGGQLDISYRCNNNHVGRASKTGLGAWSFSDIGVVPSGAAGDPGQGLARSWLYIVGYDGRVYRCSAGQKPAACILSDGNNYPYGVDFVGAPGVVVSQTSPTEQWYLVADTQGNMWQFDAYYGWWTKLGQATCGAVEGDVSATVVDDAHNYWFAAARCAAEDKIAVYKKSSGSWQQSDTVSWTGLPLSKPSVQLYYHPTYGTIGNVAFQTALGEQRLVYYYPTKAEYGWGSATP
jgi:hypothetical protein